MEQVRFTVGGMTCASCAARVSGRLEKSPFCGISIRTSQSSVTIETHVPVRSIGANLW